MRSFATSIPFALSSIYSYRCLLLLLFCFRGFLELAGETIFLAHFDLIAVVWGERKKHVRMLLTFRKKINAIPL